LIVIQGEDEESDQTPYLRRKSKLQHIVGEGQRSQLCQSSDVRRKDRVERLAIQIQITQ
jgi:hypothetical protein